MKYLGKTEFRHVYKYVQRGKTIFMAQIYNSDRRCKNTKQFKDLRKAAKWIDLKLIEFGKEPVNILKRVAA